MERGTVPQQASQRWLEDGGMWPSADTRTQANCAVSHFSITSAMTHNERPLKNSKRTLPETPMQHFFH